MRRGGATYDAMTMDMQKRAAQHGDGMHQTDMKFKEVTSKENSRSKTSLKMGDYT